MIDFILGALIVALLVRGWLRGLVREAVSLAVLLAGTLLAFRLSEPAGAVVSAMAGTSHDVSRYAGGVVVFVLVAVGGAVVSHVAQRGVQALPGLPTLNRVGGAAIGGVGGLVVATVAFSAIALLAPQTALASSIERSAFGSAMLDPDGVPQAALGTVAGDGLVASVLRLKTTFGSERFVTDDRSALVLPPTARAVLSRVESAEQRVLDLLNRTRVVSDAPPVSRLAALDEIAAAEARKLYVRSGRRSRSAKRVIGAGGVPVVDAAEVIALAPSAGSIHQGIVESSTGLAATTDLRYSKAGIATVRGPYGLLTVVLLAS